MAILVKSTTNNEDKNFWATNWFCFYDAERLYGKNFKLDVAAEYRPVKAVMNGVFYNATVTTAKVSNFFTLPWSDALENDWVDDWYCNPPFDLKVEFIQKAIEQSKKGFGGMMLIPHEPLTDWWLKNIEPHADTIYLPDGRYSFYERDSYTKKNGVNFGSCFVLFTSHTGNGQPRQVRFNRTMQGSGKSKILPPFSIEEYKSFKDEIKSKIK